MDFPIVKNILAKLLSDDIKSITPICLEEAAKGRPIKPYPFKYDAFSSAEDLKNYIEDVLYKDKSLKPEWLKISNSSHLPFNLRDDIYYTSVNVFSITCYMPPEHPFDDIIQGTTICELKPDDPLIAEVRNIINQLNKKS